jgi:RNA polymerase sigma factor (sigma-70 family)
MYNQHDPQLVEAACLGDPEAIEQLLLQYHPTITRFARKFCATPEDVEDAVQETLWIAYQKIGALRTSAAFAAWVFRIVKHQCYRLLRIKKREYNLADMSDGYSLGDDADDNAELYAALKQDVIQALACLPTQQRQVLIMRDIQNMTGPEVAAALGLSIETVKSRLHRARNILRQHLEHWNE